eukprot:TRINITY_DN50501_c0_g1_i1.p1 TRINITY_DN50501_c0_g1~~TRINITY_DN50501_c0_g1_i1.p1  ORF type:complete len:233 (+),score=43.64 TRINITY_DN50501_c0_g1_i1:89-787(+)
MMALRTAMPRVASMASPLRAGIASRAPMRFANNQPMLQTCNFNSMTRVAPQTRMAAVTAALEAQKKVQAPQIVGGIRAMSSWRLRPYAAAGTTAGALSSLSAGHSKVGLSLLVMPHKALPMALALAPTVWVLPAMYRMIFQNSMRHTTASVFTVILYLVLSFTPVPCFENLFSELTFYGIALVSTFFMYTFFPEVLLHDFMFMHYLALFTIPLIPLAFAYMPMFAARSYLFL